MECRGSICFFPRFFNIFFLIGKELDGADMRDFRFGCGSRVIKVTDRQNLMT